MHIAFLNPQGNFDPNDSYWTQHPDFGGQLVYVKEVALALAAQGHQVDIITRQIIDEAWPQFAAPTDHYPGHPNLRILRLPCGPSHFLAKEDLWPYLGTEWITNILNFYQDKLPNVFTAHYADGGLVGTLLHLKTGRPFTLTAHSLGAQKMDKLQVSFDNLAKMDKRYRFKERIMAERLSMNHANCIIVSTQQEQLEQYTHQAYHGAIDPNKRDKDRFTIIPPGVNRTIFSPEVGDLDEPIKARLEAALTRDLPPDRHNLPLVICSGRLDHKKNHLGLVQAFVHNSTLAKKANLALIVRGLDNPLQQRDQLPPEEKAILDKIATLLDQHNLWSAVTSFPLNNQAELAAAYRLLTKRHSVFALTAHYEPFGLAPLEAMSCGLPVIVTRNGGPRESLYDAETQTKYGVLVNPTNPEAIAQGILSIISTSNNWHYYHQAGLERVIKRYTWERTAEAYATVFQNIIAENKQATSRPTLLIPNYFNQPTPSNKIALPDLAAVYFEEDIPDDCC